MTRLRDVVELKAIFGNISTWATSEFRDRISAYVVQWRNRFPSTSLDEDEDEEIESLTTRIGKLKISRTNSLRFSNQSSSTKATTCETSHPHLPNASSQINYMPEAKSQQRAFGPDISDSAFETDQEKDQSSKDNGAHGSMKTTVVSSPLSQSLISGNEMVLHVGELANANDADVKVTICSSDDINGPNILPTPAAPPLRREAVSESPTRRLLTPGPSRPRGASTGSNILRDSNPASFRASVQAHVSGTSYQGNMLHVGKLRGERPRSFDATEFEGVKFAFDNSVRRAKDDEHLNMPKKHVRVFSAHDLDDEEFTFVG
jgi:hypothetical protein